MGGESTDFLKKGEKTVKGGEESTQKFETTISLFSRKEGFYAQVIFWDFHCRSGHCFGFWKCFRPTEI
jgi:hypothetical protein